MALRARHPARQGKELKPISPRQARKIFKDKTPNPWMDIGRQASVIAPANPTDTMGIKAQHRWAQNPNQLDIEGIDTKGAQPITALSARPFSRRSYGTSTFATGADPNKPYALKFKIVPLAALVASHTAGLATNPKFPEELQPRLRDRVASRLQIEQMAKSLNPEALLVDVGTLDRGPMIVGPDNVVESGNGRVLALTRTSLDYPQQLRIYQERLRAILPTYGLTLADIEHIKDPVLVRERQGNVDRAAFAAEANQSAVLGMSPLEHALQDAGRISDAAVAQLTFGENQSIEQALRAVFNRPFVQKFVGSMAPNERADLISAKGDLNVHGLQRIKGAIFAKLFPGAAGQRLSEVFLESIDPSIKTVELAIFDALPALARSEALLNSGQRGEALAIGDDLGRVVDIMARLKAKRMTVDDFVRQVGFLDRELDPFEERMLIHLDSIVRSRKLTREFLQDYAVAVEASPHPSQGSLLPGNAITKKEIIDTIIKTQTKETSGPLFGTIEAREQMGEFTATSEAQRKGLESINGHP